MERLRQFPLVYLASPYTKFEGGIAPAFEEVCRIAGRLVKYGVNVYSPIAHTHPIAIHSGINPLDHDLWLSFDAALIAKSDAVCVAMMQGWDKSLGVKREVGAFTLAQKPVFYLDPLIMAVHE